MISKTMRAILHALSYSNVEVEAARKLADLKKLDAMRIFLKKLDTKVYNGDYEVPVRLYFPNEEAMKTSQGLAYPILLFFHGGGWVTDSVENYDRVCSRMAQDTGHIVISVEYRLAPEHRFPIGLEDCYAAARTLYMDLLRQDHYYGRQCRRKSGSSRMSACQRQRRVYAKKTDSDLSGSGKLLYRGVSL